MKVVLEISMTRWDTQYKLNTTHYKQYTVIQEPCKVLPMRQNIIKLQGTASIETVGQQSVQSMQRPLKKTAVYRTSPRWAIWTSVSPGENTLALRDMLPTKTQPEFQTRRYIFYVFLSVSQSCSEPKSFLIYSYLLSEQQHLAPTYTTIVFGKYMNSLVSFSSHLFQL